MSEIDNMRQQIAAFADLIESITLDIEAVERLALSLGATSANIEDAKSVVRGRDDITSRIRTQYLPMRRALETLCTLVTAQDQMQRLGTPPKAN
jgi:hypothetical protein